MARTARRAAWWKVPHSASGRGEAASAFGLRPSVEADLVVCAGAGVVALVVGSAVVVGAEEAAGVDVGGAVVGGPFEVVVGVAGVRGHVAAFGGAALVPDG